MKTSPGKKFKETLQKEIPLQIVGTINAYQALQAQAVGFQALYLSGAGVANSSYGLPDLGMTTLDNVLEDARRITSRVGLPLLVDIDTGWGTSLMIERAVFELCRAGVAGVHIEDQVFEKKCGHLPGKKIVPLEEMVERITAAVAARPDPDFVIMARTDAFANEGLEGAIRRAIEYKRAGADMLFPEALTELKHYQAIKEACSLPQLANITEFGKTPLFTLEELKEAGIEMALYPLSANRAMNEAALNAYTIIRKEGTQTSLIPQMQTRNRLYEILEYDKYEKRLYKNK